MTTAVKKAKVAKYYKVINKDNTSIVSGFDYSKYLPSANGKRPGKWLPAVKNIKLYCRGYHVSQYYNMHVRRNTKIYEVEIKGKRVMNNGGGISKFATCERIRLVRDVTDKFIGKEGMGNTGYKNPGDFNTGDLNTGKWNGGSANTGDANTGNYNVGNNNSGSGNTGNWNSGDYNSGMRNSGHGNTGNFNVGFHNTGHFNVGDCNRGSFNTGNWNAGNWNSGYFNTTEPTVRMFNKDTGLKRNQVEIPGWLKAYASNGDENGIKDMFNNQTTIQDIRDTLALPNFDYKVFERITGISKRDFVRRVKQLIRIQGKGARQK